MGEMERGNGTFVIFFLLFHPAAQVYPIYISQIIPLTVFSADAVDGFIRCLF